MSENIAEVTVIDDEEKGKKTTRLKNFVINHTEIAGAIVGLALVPVVIVVKNAIDKKNAENTEE